MPDYSQAWRSRRFWARLPLFPMGTAVVLMIAMGQIPALRSLEPLLPVLGVAFIACMVLANIRLASFICPRCRKRFNSGVSGSGGFSFRPDLGKACGNCGLEQDAQG